jgi:Domain of unknown function (DUF1707)
MLASDRERQATVLRLRAAHLEGRLDTDELEARIGRAHAARTREELDAVEADLPERPNAAIPTTSGVPRMPGRRHFSERKLLDAPPDQVREAALAFLVPPLERYEYLLHQEGDDVLVFTNPRHGPTAASWSACATRATGARSSSPTGPRRSRSAGRSRGCATEPGYAAAGSGTGPAVTASSASAAATTAAKRSGGSRGTRTVTWLRPGS